MEGIDMENMSPLELYYESRYNHYLSIGLDEEESEFEAYGDIVELTQKGKRK
jgi:hypothetical protein